MSDAGAVERAARALFQDDYPDRSWDDQPPAYWARPSRDDYRRAARVALTAAAAPTVEQVAAEHQSHPGRVRNGGETA